MKTEIVITATVQELAQEFESELYALFQKRIEKEHGKDFIFSNDGEVFTAKKNYSSVKPIIDLNQNVEDFCSKTDFPPSKRGYAVRAHNTLMAYASKYSLRELLGTPYGKTKEWRNYGQGSHAYLETMFKELGIEVEKYPFFQ